MSIQESTQKDRYQPLISVVWEEDSLKLLDQRLLPENIIMRKLATPEEVWEAIHSMVVRGAPAIGIAAAYGVVLGAKRYAGADKLEWLQHIHKVCAYLATSRPTAVNLFWALDRMKEKASRLAASEDGMVRLPGCPSRRSGVDPSRRRGRLPPDRRACAAAVFGRHGRPDALQCGRPRDGQIRNRDRPHVSRP